MSLEQNERLSRRDFLKLSGKTFLGAMLIKLPNQHEERSSLSSAMKDVSFSFDFVNHSQKNDIDGIRHEVLNNDLLIIENLGWTKEMEGFFNSVSRGEKSVREINDRTQSPYFRQMLTEIIGTKKLVRFVDVPKDSELDFEGERILSSDSLDYSKKISEQAGSLYLRFQEYASWQRRRENDILINLANTVREEGKSGTFAGKEMKVMVIYGASHTRLMHFLKEQNNVDYQYPSTPFIYSYEDEAKRRFWFAEDSVDPKKVKRPDGGLLARVILERMLKVWFYYPNEKAFADTSQLDVWLREVVSKFTPQEITDIWEFQRVERQKKGLTQAGVALTELRDVLAKMMLEKKVDRRYVQAGLI